MAVTVSNMKVLITTPYKAWPPNSGGAVRTVNIARCLHELGHEVYLLTGDSAPADFIERGLCDQWCTFKFREQYGYFLNASFLRRYKQMLDTGINLVVSSFPYQALMLLVGNFKRKIPIIYDAHNLEALRFRSMGQPYRAAVVRAMESVLCRYAKGVLAVSNEDLQLFDRHYGVKAQLLPNGVDSGYFTPGAPDKGLTGFYGLENKKVVLYFGAFDYPPNVDALQFLVNNWKTLLQKEPDARLLIVGRYAPDWAYGIEGVVVAGAVEDIAAHLRLANIVAVPLKSGGGSRLKIIEAMASGQTVLSTPFGAAGISHENRVNGLIISGLNEFVGKLLSLLATPPEPCSSADACRFARQFDWKRMVSSIDWERFIR